MPLNQTSTTEIATQSHEKLRQVETTLEQALEGVSARAAFASYALSRFAQLHSDNGSKGARPAPVAVELAAWLLFPKFNETGSEDADGIERVINALESYQTAYMFSEMFPVGEDYNELNFHLRLATGNIRGSAYPIQVRRRIQGIFVNLEQTLSSKVGLGPLRGVEIAMAILAQTEENINSMRSRFHLAREDLTSLKGAEESAEREKKIATLRHEMLEALDGMGGAWIATREQIGKRVIGLTNDEWETLHTALGFSPKTAPLVSRVVDMQDRPLYFVSPDRVFSLQGTTVLDAIFSFFDEFSRKDASLVNRYADQASKWMEGIIAEQMCRLFPHGNVLQSACFPDPDNEGGETEADVVVSWGPFLVILEAKNNRIPKSAVRGDGKGLKNAISKNIQNAFYQARRVIRVLEKDREVTFKERLTGRTLTVKHDKLRRIMPVSVTLQHMYGIATQLAVTQRLGLFKGNAYPWSVSIDDLDVITRFAGGPDAFLYYIERRTAHQGLGIQLNGDELDILGQFLDNRLHPSVYEGRKEVAEHSGFGSISFSGGEEKFEPFYVAEWYGEKPPEQMPLLQLPETIAGFLEELRRRRDDDARFIAFALLSLNHSALVRVDQAVKSFRSGSGPKYQILRSTIVEDDVVINVLVQSSMAFDEFFKNVSFRTRLEHYRAKAKATLSFGIDLRKRNAFEIAQWLEGPWQYERVLEAAIESDRGQKRLFHLPEGSKKPGRNDPCPCGSGRKFKKCCIGSVELRKERND